MTEIEWQPPPPGDTREQLPDDILAMVVLRPYISTACEMEAALRQAMVRHPDRREAITMWRDRMHERCRLNNEFSGRLCACARHAQDRADKVIKGPSGA